MKIQKELDETKIVLHKTIESVLERGEKIDSLVEKSDGLSAQSKMFYSKRPAISLDGMFHAGLTSSFSRTGKAAKFLLHNHVKFSTAHSVAEKPALQSVCFGNTLSEKIRCSSAASLALSSTSLPGPTLPGPTSSIFAL